MLDIETVECFLADHKMKPLPRKIVDLNMDLWSFGQLANQNYRMHAYQDY